MTRIARCSCGSLRAEADGEPMIVAACHCRECQRRTGAAFGVSAYYRKEAVRTQGPSRTFTRSSDAGRQVQTHFCPDCGTTVYWFAEFRPDYVGIAVGAFADPGFPSPAWSVWEETRHEWVAFGQALDRYARAVPVSPTRT